MNPYSKKLNILIDYFDAVQRGGARNHIVFKGTIEEERDCAAALHTASKNDFIVIWEHLAAEQGHLIFTTNWKQHLKNELLKPQDYNHRLTREDRDWDDEYLTIYRCDGKEIDTYAAP